MTYATEYYYAPRYKYTSSNQHGDRFKKIAPKKINVVKLSCKRDNASDLEDLVVLSHTLNVPVHYDFEKGEASIKITSGEEVERGDAIEKLEA